MDDHLDYDLNQIELSELIMIVGSFIFAGSTLDKIEDDVIVKLLELLEEEYNYRLTGMLKNEIIH